MKSLSSSIVALMLALSLASCSTRFHQDWKKAAAASVTTSPKNVAGAWQGTWKSEATGHHGTLLAVVASQPGKPDAFDFHYHATWKHILSGTFESEHIVRIQGKNFILTGQHDLGPLFGGVYHYDGTATPTMLTCRYRCNLDHGIFEMQRP
ncbi:hypothetical protein BH11VER1_BH11VER1_35970 [soil metagenome]